MSMVQPLDQKIVSLGVRYRAVLIGVVALAISMVYAFLLARNFSMLMLWAAPAALVGTLFFFKKPEYGAVVLLGLTWGFLSEIATKYYSLPSITKVLAPLLLFVIVMRRFTGERKPMVYDPTTWWMLAYLFVVALGVWYAANPQLTLDFALEHFKDVLLYIVIINLIVSTKQFELSLWVLLAIGALLGTLTLFQELTQNYANSFGGLARIKLAFITDDIGNRPRAGGTTGEPLAYGQQLLVLVPIGLWGVLHGRTTLARSFAMYAVAMCVAGILLSFSRSTYIALGVMLIVFALHIHLNPRYLVMAAVLVTLVFSLASPEFKSRFGTLENLVPGQTSEGIDSEGSFRRRYTEMLMAVYMFGDNPIIGVGAVNYRELYPEYIRRYGSPVEDAERNAHSYYLEIAAESGLLGLITWGGILVMTFNRLQLAQRLFRGAGNRRMSELAVALQLAFAGYLVSALFFHGAYPRYLWLQVAIAVAFAVTAKRYVAAQETTATAQPVTIASTAAAT